MAWEVVDTPGTHNLVPMSEDEAVSRNILLSDPVDALVQVGDAKNLARTLLLALQLAELGIPFCLDLNMADEARARSLRVDIAALERELPGVRVALTTATDAEGLDEIRAALERSVAETAESAGDERLPLACAPRFPEDIEQAIRDVESALGPTLVAKRALATMLLAATPDARLAVPNVSDEARRVANDRSRSLEASHGSPPFAILNRLRIERARALVRAVQTREAPRAIENSGDRVEWVRSALIGLSAGLLGALFIDEGIVHCSHGNAPNPQGPRGLLDILARLPFPRAGQNWNAFAAVVGCLVTGLSILLVRRHARARSAVWKLLGTFVASWIAWQGLSAMSGAVGRGDSAAPAVVAAFLGLAILTLAVRVGDTRDAWLSQAFGRSATHPIWGVPILSIVLFLAYEIVGVFGAGTAVNFFENDVFGTVSARAALDGPRPAVDDLSSDFAPVGTERLVVTDSGLSRRRVVSQVRTSLGYVPDPSARVDVTGRGVEAQVVEPGVVDIRGDLRGVEAMVWTGHINRAAYAFFAWLGIPLLTALVVGPYGLLTMGVTYAVAIVLPVVATFFFVFSILEDSGYLPRLAVMANRTLRTMGLNGKAVLPMVLGLGCDTMATLTARIMATRKERALVTLILALGIPCSSQLSVIFALMQRTSLSATCIWVAVVLATILGVGWIAARVLPGDSSDFLLEMPPIRRPMVTNIVAKTLARIEWYLREAVPLFLAGTALLFVLDTFHMLGAVHRLGEPVVHRLLGFSRDGGVADRVSEALVVGFLRRDFGAAGLLQLARAGVLTPADVAVSMVTITLFIPCIANLFMIGKERGWRVAAMMSAFIFPYAIAVGAAVRLGFRVFGGS